MKDWKRDRSLIHLLGWLADRVVAGERVRYETADSLRALLSTALPTATLIAEGRLPPRPNNLAFLLRS